MIVLQLLIRGQADWHKIRLKKRHNDDMKFLSTFVMTHSPVMARMVAKKGLFFILITLFRLENNTSYTEYFVIRR